jgi:hypothetical protein
VSQIVSALTTQEAKCQQGNACHSEKTMENFFLDNIAGNTETKNAKNTKPFKAHFISISLPIN